MGQKTPTITFRPWDPLTWPSLNLLNPLFLLLLIICRLSEPKYKKIFLEITATILTIILIKLFVILFHRYQRLKLFDQCNIVSVGKKNPISGNLFDVIAPKNNIHIIDGHHKKLGKTFGIFYGPDPWVFTTDVELLHKLFVAEGSKYVDIAQLRLPFITEINNSLAQIQGDKWRYTRRVLNPPFKLKQMKSDNVYLNISQAVDTIMASIAGHPLKRLSGSEDQGECRLVDVLYSMKKFSVDVIFQVAYGKVNGVNMEPGEKDKLIDTILAAAMLVRGPVVWSSIMFDGWDRMLGLMSKLTPIGRYIGHIHSVLGESLETRRAQRMQANGCVGRKLIDTIIECSEKNKMDYETLKANMFFTFLAGFETSANTGAALLWLLALNQDKQDKLRESLLVDGESSQYLDWCINEALRLYPAVPTAVGRIVQEEFVHKGQTFKKGVSVMASIFSLHRWEEYWGQDALEFRPERFGEAQVNPLQFFPFAHGPRSCMGSSLAMMELRAIVSRMLLSYRLEPLPDTPKLHDLEYISPNLIHIIIESDLHLKLIELSSI